MGVSKVTLNGVTLMDVTDKTVDTDNLLAGNSALRNDGESITGAVVTASPSDASPAMDGTASAGVATTYSRGDHVHPSDTNKANINNPSFTGIPTAPTASKGTDTTQIATTAFVQSAITDINYPVTSVNTKTGAVVLTASDVGALPSTTSIPTATSDLTNDSGYITNSDIPVTSVNTKTGDVVLTAADVNAQPQINISGILKGNGTGTITAATAGTDYQAPLPSQTGNTGKFLTTNGSALSWQTVDALPSQSGNTGKFLTTDGSSPSWAEVDIPTKTSELTNDSNFVSDANYVHTDNNFTGTLKTKLEGIAEGAEVNQNAFSNVKVGTSTIAADTKTDTLTLTAGSNITLTPDTTNDAVTIAATVPTKVSDLTNDSNFITAADAPVQSVNSKTGTVTLTASDVGALPSTTSIPAATSDLTNDSGFITSSDIPVTSVNTKTGAVSLSASDVGALPDSTDVTKWNGVALSSTKIASSTKYYIPAKSTGVSGSGTADWLSASQTPTAYQIPRYDSNSYLYSTTPSASDNSTKVATTAYVDSAVGAITVPVTSVNSKTGAVVLDAEDVGALPDSTDVTKWGTATLGRSGANVNADTYIPQFTSQTATSTNMATATKTPTNYAIAKYDSDAYLNSTTPATSDNSTKVATTAFVKTAISNIDVLPSQTSHNGEFLTTNGTVASWKSLPEEVFVATYGTTTLAEVLEAYNAGKFIYAVKSNNPGRLVPLEEYVSSIPQFYFSYITRGGTPQEWTVSNGGWTSTVNTFGYVPTTRTINSKSLSNSITLTASDVGALPDSTTIPTATSDLTNDSGFITSSDIPVTSVNSKTGAVSLTASDLGALTNSYFGYFDSDNNIIYAPKNWNSSYLFPFVVRTISSTLRTGATVRAFDSSTNLWTISSIYYDGVAKTLPLSLSYGIYLMRYSDGTTDIYRIAKASDIPTLTSTPTANKGAKYDSSAYLNSTTPAANDNSTKVATTAYVDTAVAGAGSGAKGVTNPALTASEEIFTWSIAAADAFSSPNVIISVYDTATGAIVYPDIVVNQTTGAVTITIRDTASVGSLAAGTYRAVIIG